MSIAQASAAVEALLKPVATPSVQPVKAVVRATPPKADVSLELDDETDDERSAGEADDLLDDDPEDEAPAPSDSDDDADDEPDDNEEITATSKRGKTLTLKRGDLKDGLRRADYSRKTAAAAELARKAETELATLQGERTQLSKILEAQATAEEESIPPEPDAAERETDPGSWAAKREVRKMALERVQGLRAYRAKLDGDVVADAQKAFDAKVKDEYGKLVEKVPKWKDPAKFDRDTTIIRRGIAKNYGIPEQAIAATVSHEAVLVMRDALRYRQMVAKRDAIPVTTDSAIPVLKPGGKAQRTDPTVEKAKASLRQLNKTGSIADGAAALIANGLLASRKR